MPDLRALSWDALNNSLFPGHDQGECSICDAVRAEILRRIEEEDDGDA